MRDPLPAAGDRPTLIVVGVGNAWRGDDAAGLLAARRLRRTLPEGVAVLEHGGDPGSLIEAWRGADALWLLDAVASGAAPGTVHRVDAGEASLAGAPFRVSSHRLGLADAVELARALGRLPAEVVVYGIAGERFDLGDRPTPEVEAGVRRAAAAVEREVRARLAAPPVAIQ